MECTKAPHRQYHESVVNWERLIFGTRIQGYPVSDSGVLCDNDRKDTVQVFL